MTAGNGSGIVRADSLKPGTRFHLHGINTPAEVRQVELVAPPGYPLDDYAVEVRFEAGDEEYDITLDPTDEIVLAIPKTEYEPT